MLSPGRLESLPLKTGRGEAETGALSALPLLSRFSAGPPPYIQAKIGLLTTLVLVRASGKKTRCKKCTVERGYESGYEKCKSIKQDPHHSLISRIVLINERASIWSWGPARRLSVKVRTTLIASFEHSRI